MEYLVEKAQAGNREALEDLVRQVQTPVYELALRMLGHPADAEDATQEILIKVITRIGGFRAESAFATWVYRIAANHLRTTRKRRAERMGLSFEIFEDGIVRRGEIPDPGTDPEKQLLLDELRSNCMQAILICLHRDLRLAFILSDIFEVTGEEGAWILDIQPPAFRQRASRAREKVRQFMTNNCGLVNPAGACHCTRQIDSDLRRGWIDPANPLYAKNRSQLPEPALPDRLANRDEATRIAVLFQTYPLYATPDSFANRAKQILTARRRNT